MSFRTPSYRHHKPTGQAVVTLDGRDIYLGKHGSATSKAEYDRLIAEWLSNGRCLLVKSEGEQQADLAVSEIILGFLKFADEYYRKDGKPSGEIDNIRLAIRLLRKLYGHTQAGKFGPLALKAVRQAMIDSGLCRNEVNRRTRYVIRVFAWAVENELIPPSVHHGLKSVPGLRKFRSGARESAPVKPVPEPFIEAVRDHVSRRIWAMIGLQRVSSMRPGEVCQIRGRDLDTTGPIWIYKPDKHKTAHHGRDRTIYIGPKGQAILRPWLKMDPEAFLFSPREAEAERLAAARQRRKTRVQPSQIDRRKSNRIENLAACYSPATYHMAIARACRRAGVPPWGPNRLRHNGATTLRREFGLDTARVILGHSSVDTTEIYAEVDREKAISAMLAIG